MPRQYPPEFRERALRLLEESLPDHPTEYEAKRPHTRPRVSRPLASGGRAERSFAWAGFASMVKTDSSSPALITAGHALRGPGKAGPFVSDEEPPREQCVLNPTMQSFRTDGN
jgi:hypothetical protein